MGHEWVTVTQSAPEFLGEEWLVPKAPARSSPWIWRYS